MSKLPLSKKVQEMEKEEEKKEEGGKGHPRPRPIDKSSERV